MKRELAGVKKELSSVVLECKCLQDGHADTQRELKKREEDL